MPSATSWLLVSAIVVFFPLPAHAVTPVGDCSTEGGLANRSDVLFCEPWEDGDWYQHFNDNSGVAPASAADVSLTHVVPSDCVSGSCLKVDMPKGVTKSLSIKWSPDVMGVTAQQLYLRYYFKLGTSWSPNMCDSSGNVSGSGGKFPGMSDERLTPQCGNGGDPGDGINCWSMRSAYRNCDKYSGDGLACANKNPGATTRFGSYLYFYNQEGSTGSAGLWDTYYWGQSWGNGGSCSGSPNDPYCSPNNCSNTPNDVYCGKSNDGGEFYNGRWYLVEMFVKMNTPGVADGVIKGWINNVLSYEKDNMIFRLVGHDNLHVRNIWLNIYKGGLDGNCNDSEVYLDQLAVATDAQIGGAIPGATDTTPPKAPTGLKVQ
jgi:Polysaccharide lyase 14